MAQQLRTACQAFGAAHLIQLHQSRYHKIHEWAQAVAQVCGGKPRLASAREIGEQLRGLPAAILVYRGSCTQCCWLGLVEQCCEI